MSIAHKITVFFIRKNWIKQEYAELYEYTYKTVLGSMLQTLSLLVLGAVLGKLIDTIVFIFVFRLLRTKTGGYHCKTRLHCIMLTYFLWILSILLTSLLCCQKDHHSDLELFYIVIFNFIVVAAYSPMSSPKKPLSSGQRKKNRWLSLIYLSILTIIATVLHWYQERIGIIIMVTLYEVCMLLIIEKFWKEGRENAEKEAWTVSG